MFGEDHVGVIVREITKMYESVKRGRLAELFEYVKLKHKGEFVVILSPPLLSSNSSSHSNANLNDDNNNDNDNKDDDNNDDDDDDDDGDDDGDDLGENNINNDSK